MTTDSIPTYQGVPADETGSVDTYSAPVQQEYFGFGGEEKFYLPDGISYIAFRIMNEGRKSSFQKDVKRDLTIERSTGNARTAVDPSVERHALIISSCTDWNLLRGGRVIEFSERNVRIFLQDADPKIVEDLETAIRKANPWLMGDVTLEDIDKSIEELKKQREEKIEALRGESSSSSK